MTHWDRITNEAKQVCYLIIYKYTHNNDDAVPSKFNSIPSKDIVNRLLTPQYLQKAIKRQERFNASKAFAALQKRRMIKLAKKCSIAASVLLAATYSIYLLQQQPLEKHNPSITQAKKTDNTSKVTLTLANGSSLALSSTSHSKDTTLGSIRISNTGLQISAATKAEEKIEYNNLSISRGAEYHLTLEDGTKVWLNSESNLRFPTHFTGKTRTVALNGEAYFQVSKKGTPFRIKMKEGTIEVYGTQFNVSNYEGEKLKATLVEGSIGFRSYSGRLTKLAPSQQLQYSCHEDNIRISTVDTYPYISWKDKVFCFEEQSLDEIMNALQRWYNVKPLFASEDLKRIKLSGQLERYNSIERFFKLFEASANVKFTLNSNVVMIQRAR